MKTKNSAKIWEETCSLPTYPVYPAEKSPLFIEKRAYQGSTGKVYPLPVTEKISDQKENVSCKAVFLENEYLKVMILPELGGRIQRAYDKTNNYDFVYYNHVIKPALVGLTGPWISGGIEFNWPQHHRPSTYSPVDYTLSENPDGSCTVYLSEIDKMYGTKGMACISLYPGKAYIEIKGKLFNNTDTPQTFLWWANPAVPVNDHTYSVFPPDVNAVMDHGKRAVSTFPIATGEYYKYDYSEGVDISRYKNIKVPTSYMAAHSDYDFIGNYDESLEAGLLHVADHHISPGKKQWTWGNSDFGQSWDRNLTDEDGPYIELMTGVFTDNQPDFTWLKPYEEKNFTQYFMPYKGVGRVCNATKDAAISLEALPKQDSQPAGCPASKTGEASPEQLQSCSCEARLRVYATGSYPAACIQVRSGQSVLFEASVSLSPESFYEAVFPAPARLEGCLVTVSFQGKTLAAYQVPEKKLAPVPSPAEALKAPKDLKSTEELYLAASHLEQYRHATYEPAEYYLEGLRRDPSDIRLNNGYGLLLLKRGHAAESIPYFRAAIQKQTWKNPNPYYGECYFNLGLALAETALQTESIDNNAFREMTAANSLFGNPALDEAYDAFYKAVWSGESKSAAFYKLACLSSLRGDASQALDFVEQSLIGNWHNMKARTLKAALMRQLGCSTKEWLESSLSIDPLYMGCVYEKALLEQNQEDFLVKMRDDAHSYLELSLLYADAGLWQEAAGVLEAGARSAAGALPLLYYYLGYFYTKAERNQEALKAFEQAEALPADYCFPNKNAEIYILETAIRALPAAPMAHYYLGCLLYDKKQYANAREHWETTIAQKPDFAMAYRNLSIAYYNKENAPKKALEAMEKAFSLDKTYPRFLLEYDQLAARLQVPVSKRLAVLTDNLQLTAKRDDLYLRYITLLNCTGRFQEALDALTARKFHPWEGGEGKVSAQYRYALIQLAKEALKSKHPDQALLLLEQSLTYPHNLGEGKLPNVPDNEAHYYMGCAFRMLGDNEKAARFFSLAASGSSEPASVQYYNDQPSDYIFYQGLALLSLERPKEAAGAFHRLLAYGERHLFDEVSYDFFAVSLPEIEVYQDEPKLRSTLYCTYLQALGNLGLSKLHQGQTGFAEAQKAKELFLEILSRQDDYQGAVAHLALL